MDNVRIGNQVYNGRKHTSIYKFPMDTNYRRFHNLSIGNINLMIFMKKRFYLGKGGGGKKHMGSRTLQNSNAKTAEQEQGVRRARSEEEGRMRGEG